MRTPSGILHVVDFKTSQIVSNIQPKDYWDDKRHWEIKNNVDTLEFKVFDNTDHAATLMQQNLVLKEVRDGRIVPYVITETEKNSDDRSIIVYASGEWIQLAKAGIINPQKIEGKTVNEFIDMALVGTKWKRGKTEYAGFHTMTIDEFIDPLKFLKDIASLFELEIQYRAEVVGSQIVGRYVDMVKKRGRDTGKEVTLGKDLMGIKRIENSQNICTALLGFVKKEGGDFITISSINNGVPYLVDNDAFQRWNERGQHKFGFYTPETEEDITPQRLLTLMKIEMAKRINTSYIYDVQAQSIGRVFGLAHELINEGDTIRIKDTGFTPKLYLEARVIVGDESFTDPTQDKNVFGDYREIVDANEELRKLYNKILASLGDKQELLDKLDELVKETSETASNAQKESEAAKKLAEKVQENIKNYQTTIIESKTAPTTGLEPGKSLWLDISNGKPGILKLWKNGIWESVVPDVESVKTETLKKVNEDIEKTKTELNTKVETVKTETLSYVNTQVNDTKKSLEEKVAAVKKETESISGQIVNIKQDIENKVDGNFVKEQIKDKADKAGVFTKDEIREGFIGKQIYETDKSGNVKKFQEISTSVEQTNESIKNLATKQSVTDLGNNITQVSKTANEAKQTAEGNTRIITQVDSKVKQTAEDFNKKTTVIEETVNGITKNVTNIQTEQGKISERVTKSEQTAEGFKQSIESLNKADGVISNKLNTVEQTVEGTKKTIADIQSEANALKKTTNEIKETADGTKQTLTQLKTKVDNTKITVRNLIRYSGDFAKGWNIFQNISELKVVDDNRFGKILEAKCDALTTGRSPAISNTPFLVEAGKEYTLSLWIKRETAGTVTQLSKFRDEKGKESNPVAFPDVTVPANTWYYLTQTFIVPATAVQMYITPRIATAEASKKFWIAQPILTEGNIDTGWQPAPEDQVNLEEFTKKTVEIENNINGIKNSVSNVQNEQGKISERVTKSEQTAGGFKTSIESLTKKDNDISNKLNTVEQTVEGTKKTISDVQQTTNDLKKTTTEIKEQAGKISEKLTSVETKVANDKAGGRNLLLNSNAKYEKTDFLINQYTLSENFSTGEEYTFVIKGIIPQGQKFGIWQNGGSNNVGYATSVYANGITYVTFKAVAPTVGNEKKLSLYNAPQNTTKATVEWVALYKGNKPQDWTPAPENQVTNDEFTKKTTELEKSVEGVKTTVTNVQNSQVGFEKRMSNVEQTASGLSSTVSNLNNVVSDQGKKITDANTKIEQQAQAIKAKVEIKQVEDYVGGFKIPELKNTVTKNKQDLIEEIAKKVATQDYNKKTTELERLISANAQGISLAAIKTEVYTKVQADGKYADKAYVEKQAARIDLTEKNILSTVQKGDIISAINQTAEKITIDVAKLNINADTMVKWLTAKGIDTNLIRINGDKITIDKDGVTVKMLDFLFQDEWGTKTTAVSRRNLIADPDFSSVTKKNIGNADYYGFEGGYGLTWKSWGNVVIEKNTHVFDYEQMVNAARVDMYNYPEAIVNNGIHPGNEYTLSAHFRTAMINGVRKTGKPRLQVCCVTFRDNVSYDTWNEQKMDFPEPSTYYGEIRRYSFTFKVPTNYIPQQHALIIKVCSGNADMRQGTAVCVSGVTLYSGKYASMYNWDRAAAERADGLQPFNRIAIGGVNNNIGPADNGQTFNISTEKDVSINQPILTQGINLGRNRMGQAGSIRFFDGGQGYGFYFMGMGGQWYKLPNV